MSNGELPAFNDPDGAYKPGLTKREYIAAAVIQGLAAGWSHYGRIYTPEELADDAVKCANALLKRLSTQQQSSMIVEG